MMMFFFILSLMINRRATLHIALPLAGDAEKPLGHPAQHARRLRWSCVFILCVYLCTYSLPTATSLPSHALRCLAAASMFVKHLAAVLALESSASARPRVHVSGVMPESWMVFLHSSLVSFRSSWAFCASLWHHPGTCRTPCEERDRRVHNPKHKGGLWMDFGRSRIAESRKLLIRLSGSAPPSKGDPRGFSGYEHSLSLSSGLDPGDRGGGSPKCPQSSPRSGWPSARPCSALVPPSSSRCPAFSCAQPPLSRAQPPLSSRAPSGPQGCGGMLIFLGWRGGTACHRNAFLCFFAPTPPRSAR